MPEVGPERVEKWLDEPQYPDAVWKAERLHINRHLRQVRLPLDQRVLLEAAAVDELVVDGYFVDANQGKKFLVTFKVSDVIIEEQCVPDHDWGEWSYDFMGGDIRRCKRCNKSEMV